ncbi:hypothetical protein [uncultured Clostridium sp.]|uniref:hypothetical protein n=1 Tax=uncultured Clostridium sp. TaxID=59620 RepID=UPI0028EDC142|nr:hypothetical protein [uncultured Clostridium sp.]
MQYRNWIVINKKQKDEDIYEAKIKLAEELVNYDKVKNNEQIKALVDFLEYLFLIQSSEIEKKYNNYKKKKGGVLKMTVDEIRKLHYTQKGKEEGREEGIKQGKLEIAKNLLDILDNKTISEKTGLTEKEVDALRMKKSH